VASYETYWGATLAVEQLHGAGIGVDDIEVTAHDVRPPHGWTQRARRQAQRWPAVATGMIAGGACFAAAILGKTSLALASLLALLAGAIVGLVYGGIEARSTRRAREAARTSTTVDVGRFDVVCSRDVRSAAHQLAKWWNPEATPVLGPAAVLDPPARAWRQPRAAAA
jgi:hypothetical protein